LVQQFLHVSASPAFRESLAAIDEVKTVLRKYLPWAISFFGNERLAPVAKHYASLIQSRQVDGQALPFLVFGLPEPVAKLAVKSLEDLEQHRVKTAADAIEGLIQVIDVSLEVLLKQPKTLLKFNFVVDKTLNGVINMTTAMSYKNLRKLGQQLDPSLFDPLTNHLRSVMISKCWPNRVSSSSIWHSVMVTASLHRVWMRRIIGVISILCTMPKVR